MKSRGFRKYKKQKLKLDNVESIEQIGGQGYSPASDWSRGNALAVYGLSIAYRHFGDQKYLTAAKRVAHYFVAALPEDAIPYWDFRLPSLEGEPRDSSAAAIAASGLIEQILHIFTSDINSCFYIKKCR